MSLFSLKNFTSMSVLWAAFLVFNFLISFTTSSKDTFKNKMLPLFCCIDTGQFSSILKQADITHLYLKRDLRVLKKIIDQ